MAYASLLAVLHPCLRVKHAFLRPSLRSVSVRDDLNSAISGSGSIEGMIVDSSANDLDGDGDGDGGGAGTCNESIDDDDDDNEALPLHLLLFWDISAEEGKSSLISLQMSSPSSRIKFASPSGPDTYGSMRLSIPGNVQSVRRTASSSSASYETLVTSSEEYPVTALTMRGYLSGETRDASCSSRSCAPSTRRICTPADGANSRVRRLSWHMSIASDGLVKSPAFLLLLRRREEVCRSRS